MQICLCFNEAGAINAGKRHYLNGLCSAYLASMRPAQLTPENITIPRRADPARFGFNEAGAINAGKPHEDDSHHARSMIASMRPAQLTPENTDVGILAPDDLALQ